MITIWKLEDGSWSFIGEFTGSIEQLRSVLSILREDGCEYRVEKTNGGFSSILEE